MSIATATSPASAPSPVVPRAAGSARMVAALRRAAERRRLAVAPNAAHREQLTDDYIDRYGTAELDSRTLIGFMQR